MKCEREGKWIGGCKFEARFDSVPHNGAGFTSIKSMTGDTMSVLLTKRTYVRDVCVSCGKTIERVQ